MLHEYKVYLKGLLILVCCLWLSCVKKLVLYRYSTIFMWFTLEGNHGHIWVTAVAAEFLYAPYSIVYIDLDKKYMTRLHAVHSLAPAVT